MARKIINTGSGPGAGDGECIRDAFEKINDNFDEVYALANQEDGHLTTDVTGSVFADDTSALVDGVAGKIVGPIDNEEITTTKIIGSDIPQVSGMTPILEVETEVFTVCANGATYVADAVVPCPDATSLTLDNTDGTGGTVKVGNTGGGGILEIDNTGGGGILTLEGGNGGGSLVIDEGNSGNGGNVTIEGGGSGGGSLIIEGDNTTGSGNVIIEGGNSGGTLILEEGSSAGSGNVYLQSAGCGSSGSIVLGGCNGVGGRVILDSILDTLTLGDATGINIDIDVSNRGITLGDTSSAGTSRINIDGDADRIRLGDFTGLSIDIDVNNDGINLGDLAGQFFTLDNANKTTTLGSTGGTQVEIDDTAKTVTVGDTSKTKMVVDNDNDVAEIICWFPPETPGDPYTETVVFNVDGPTKTTTLGDTTGSKVVLDDTNKVATLACTDFPYEMKLDGASGVVTVGNTSGDSSATGPALILDTTTDTTTLGKVDGTSPQVVLDGDTARIGTTNNYLTVDESTNIINIGGPSINISIDASNTVTFNGGANFNNITPEFNSVSITQITSNTDHSNNLTITANNYVIIDSDNNGQIEIGRASGVGNVILGNKDNDTAIELHGDVILGRTNTASDFYGEIEFNSGTTIFQALNDVTFNCDVTGAGFTFNQPALPGDSTQFGFDADTVDFGTGNTIDMQNCSVLFTGATVTGLSIKDLSDVNSGMTPTDGQALTWDDGNSRWTSTTISTVGALTDLSDVDSSMTPNFPNILWWDNGSSHWTNISPSAVTGWSSFYDLQDTPNSSAAGDLDGGILRIDGSNNAELDAEHYTKMSVNSTGALTAEDTWGYGYSQQGISNVRHTLASSVTFEMYNDSDWVDRFASVKEGDTIYLWKSGSWDEVTVTGPITSVPNGSTADYTIPVNIDGFNDSIYRFKLSRSFDTLRDGIISSNLYSDDSSILYDAGTGEFHGTLRGDVIGSLYTDDSTQILDGVSGDIYATDLTVNGILKIEDGVHEKFTSIADAAGTVEHDYSTGHIFYHTSPDLNWEVNLTNLTLDNGYATTVTIIIEQGISGFYPSALQIDGVPQTINWQGGSVPTPSSSRTDVVTFSILLNSGTYTVLGQLVGF